MQSYQSDAHDTLELIEELAPIKVSITIDPSFLEYTTLRELSRFLSLELKNAGLTVITSSYLPVATLQETYSNCDQMGILYNVLLGEKTLEASVVSIRHRDSKLMVRIEVII